MSIEIAVAVALGIATAFAVYSVGMLTIGRYRSGSERTKTVLRAALGAVVVLAAGSAAPMEGGFAVGFLLNVLTWSLLVTLLVMAFSHFSRPRQARH